MQNIGISRAAEGDKLSGKFFKYGAQILAKPLKEICNLSITSRTFKCLKSCKAETVF